MLVTIFRTVLLYVCVITALRIMGKRQIGDLQPNELVTTILISEIATIPIQDIKQPTVNGVIAIFLLVSLEVLLSFITLKSDRIRRLVDGRPTIVIRHGRVDQAAMKRMRLTVDDLLENLRQNQVFDIGEVEYAVVETNGNMSVLLRSEHQPATAKQVGVDADDTGIPVPVVCDGKLRDEFMRSVGMTPEKLKSILDQQGISQDEVFIMTVDAKGNTVLINKEGKK